MIELIFRTIKRKISADFVPKSSERYASFAKMRSLRIGVWEIRLAVTLATAPFSNLMRALAISSSSDTTATPEASMDFTGDLTSERMTSISWIMRSSTTATSLPRGWNCAMRCDSKKRGSSRYGSAAKQRGIKPLDMPNLNFYVMLFCKRDQFFGLLGGGGDRFFDQDMLSCNDSFFCDRIMRWRGRYDRKRIDLLKERINLEPGCPDRSKPRSQQQDLHHKFP